MTNIITETYFIDEIENIHKTATPDTIIDETQRYIERKRKTHIRLKKTLSGKTDRRIILMRMRHFYIELKRRGINDIEKEKGKQGLKIISTLNQDLFWS